MAGLAALLSAIGLSGNAQAIDFGPFYLTGFVKAEQVIVNNYCKDCQRFPDENKQRVWADQLINGSTYGEKGVGTVLFQPWLGARFNLGKGFKLEGLVSQRLRNGSEDIPGYYYEKNVAISHEDYGSVRVGAMTTRTWSVADYPYGTNVAVADAWGASGAGYGLLTNALRYTSRILDVAEGDLVLEATYDRGNTDFKINKPRFLELYAQYHRGDLVVDAMYQDARNGNPQAWSHGPFRSLTTDPADDDKLGGSGQSIGMVMARYQYDRNWEFSGGIRRNRWSGAYAVITKYTDPQQWNNMFNVDWRTAATLAGGVQPGYSATSVDFMLGLRYRTGKWVASTGLVYLGKADTDNPSERGQSNSALINTAQLQYEYGNGLTFYVFAGMVHYARLGLSPMSMPGNAAFTNVDSRAAKSGNWAGFGMVYVF
jgi:hypothetical protein